MSDFEDRLKTTNSRWFRDGGSRPKSSQEDDDLLEMTFIGGKPPKISEIFPRPRVDSPTSRSEKAAEEFAAKYSNGKATTAVTETIHASGAEAGFALNEAQEQIVNSALAESGTVLAESQRTSFEQALGQDLNQVRIHTGDSAEKAAASIHAKAFTIGKDIVFGKNESRPGTKDGDHLLAHEMAHVAQGSDGIHRAPDESLEKKATRSLVNAALAGNDLLIAFMQLNRQGAGTEPRRTAGKIQLAAEPWPLDADRAPVRRAGVALIEVEAGDVVVLARRVAGRQGPVITRVARSGGDGHERELAEIALPVGDGEKVVDAVEPCGARPSGNSRNRG